MAEGAADVHMQLRGFLRRLEARVGQQVVHQRFRLVALDVAAVVAVDDELAIHLLHRAEVDAHGDLAGLEGHAHAGSLQDAAAGVAPAGVIAEDIEDGRVAAGRHALGHGLAGAGFAARQDAKVGQIQVFQGGLVSKLRDGIVAHTVADNQDILHNPSSCITNGKAFFFPVYKRLFKKVFIKALYASRPRLPRCCKQKYIKKTGDRSQHPPSYRMYQAFQKRCISSSHSPRRTTQCSGHSRRYAVCR